MEAIKQKCRPKHQVLVLKCYPRITKGAVDVKPNSSELSYLLFYATSRRSKIQKIGAFLEKKTASDVWRMRIGNVQVTLQILAALIEKSPKDLPLFATNVLKILDLVLGSNDVTMVQSSIATFEAFCENHDVSSSFAEQGYLAQYESVVRTYANLASTRQKSDKSSLSKPVQLKWRSVGLEAIRSVSSSDPLSSVAGRQFEVIVPIILENLWWDDDKHLDTLLGRMQVSEKVEADRFQNRRMSAGTAKTNETNGETNPLAIAGTTDDVDKLAEEDIGLLALQCLKQIFVVPNQPQIHAATDAMLRFAMDRVSGGEHVFRPDPTTGDDSGWAIKMFSTIANWAPVQDRYVILVTTMDRLRRLPIAEDNLQQHIALTAMVSALLRSDINLIGLSVMDVLIGFIQHIKKLLNTPISAKNNAAGEESEKDERSASMAQAFETDGAPRKELLERIQKCIGDLSTHVYYADQISDMISAILIRLRPSRASSNNSSPNVEKDGTATAQDDAHSSQSNLETYLTLSMGKTAALKAIKMILLVSNPQTKMASNMSLSRHRVPVHVWEGTHWLLRDPDRHVRKAYIDALLTWLDRETTKADLQAKIDPPHSHHRASMRSNRDLSPGHNTAKRAASSASGRDKALKQPRSHFMQLLHIVVYDNALQYVDSETDIVMLHILLTKLVFRLGVNAVQYGLPMVFRLQEDIQDADTPVQKVRLGSLCHGYFWAVTEKFDIEVTGAGRTIQNEIIRRRKKQFWVEGVNVPPPLLEKLNASTSLGFQSTMSLEDLETEALIPFDDRGSMVEAIAVSYANTSMSPPASPAASPSRNMPHPILGTTITSAPLSPTSVDSEKELPESFQDIMLTDWTKDAAMIALQAGSKSESFTASKTTGTRQQQHRSALNGSAHGNGQSGMPSSPFGSQKNLRPSNAALGGGLSPHFAKGRKSSVRSGASATPSDSSRAPVTSVSQLKAVLSGELPGTALGTSAGFRRREEEADDSGSDSMVSFDYTPSEASFNPNTSTQPSQPSQPSQLSQSMAAGDASNPASPLSPTSIAVAGSPEDQRPASRGGRGGPLSSNPPSGGEFFSSQPSEDEVPPVPPLPNLMKSPASRSGDLHRPVSAQDHALKPAKRNFSNRSKDGRPRTAVEKDDFFEERSETMDLRDLLQGIDSRSGEHSLGNITRPPY